MQIHLEIVNNFHTYILYKKFCFVDINILKHKITHEQKYICETLHYTVFIPAVVPINRAQPVCHVQPKLSINYG